MRKCWHVSESQRLTIALPLRCELTSLVGMCIATIANRDSPPAILLREGYREDGKVKTRTLANLSKLPAEAIAVLRQVLDGKQLISTDDAFEIVEDGSRADGHAEAVLTAMRRLGFSNLIDSRPSRQRDLAVAMVAARVLKPQSKLATTRWWSSTTLTEMLGLGQTDEDEPYEAMDWLLKHQASIEKKLSGAPLGGGRPCALRPGAINKLVKDRIVGLGIMFQLTGKVTIAYPRRPVRSPDASPSGHPKQPPHGSLHSLP